jgi:hypothetical protein
MGFLIGVFAMIGSFLVGVFGHVLAHDFCEFTPRMCRRLIERAANLLPEGDRARYTEEWLSHLNECPGVLAKFQHACTCLFGARSLARVRRVQKPWFRTLRIEFDDIGFVEIDFSTSMVLTSFITDTAGLLKKRPFESRTPRKLVGLWLIKNFAAACVRHRKFGPINPKQIVPFFHLVFDAIETKNTNLNIYRDGSPIDLPNTMKALNEWKKQKSTKC